MKVTDLITSTTYNMYTLLNQWKSGVGEIQFALAIGLFFITNLIGKHSFSIGYVAIDLFEKDDEAPAFNYILRVFTPIVYLVITSALLYYLKLDFIVYNFYMVSVYYVIFRFAVNLLQERLTLINWSKQSIYYVSIILFSYFVYIKTISIKANVLPDPANIVNEMWIIIIVFLYKLINELDIPIASSEKRRMNYLDKKFNEFHILYDSIISKELNNDVLKAVAYAIIIHENFNRSRIVRIVENIQFLLTHRHHSLGVMQYPTSRFINDSQSVILGARKIRRTYKQVLTTFKPEDHYYLDNSTFYNPVISKYNGGNAYQQAVGQLTERILLRYFPNTKDSIVPIGMRELSQKGE